MTSTPIFHSAEVRWFFPGPLPEVQLAWFLQAATPEEQQPSPPRTDRYLVFPGCESVGVKEREGKFEIKALRKGASGVSYPNGVAGRSDSWVKWSYERQPIVTEWLKALRQEEQGWLAVEKIRWLRNFAVFDTQVKSLSSETAFEESCGVEMTKLKLKEQEWWTIGLEASGRIENMSRNLQLVGDFFFSQYGCLTQLHTSNSCGYPTWLYGLYTG